MNLPALIEDFGMDADEARDLLSDALEQIQDQAKRNSEALGIPPSIALTAAMEEAERQLKNL